MHHIQTYDIEVATQAVKDVYCSHRLKLDDRARRVDTKLSVGGLGELPLVRLEYGAPVDVDAGDFPDMFLGMRCLAGFGTARQGDCSYNWQPGSTVLVSANIGTHFKFGADFSQLSVRFSQSRLERLCARWLGHPLGRGLRFDLRPFSASLEQAWTTALSMVESYGNTIGALPPAAEVALEEFVLTLLLKGHPHNFTEAIHAPDSRSHHWLLRRAKQFIEENAGNPITVSDIAAAFGTSVRALQSRFQRDLQTTPAAYLRQVRLELARQALINPDDSTTITDVALNFGFLHLGRFSQYYKSCFGEQPHATLMQARRQKPRST